MTWRFHFVVKILGCNKILCSCIIIMIFFLKRIPHPLEGITIAYNYKNYLLKILNEFFTKISFNASIVICCSEVDVHHFYPSTVGSSFDKKVANPISRGRPTSFVAVSWNRIPRTYVASRQAASSSWDKDKFTPESTWTIEDVLVQGTHLRTSSVVPCGPNRRPAEEHVHQSKLRSH